MKQTNSSHHRINRLSPIKWTVLITAILTLLLLLNSHDSQSAKIASKPDPLLLRLDPL